MSDTFSILFELIDFWKILNLSRPFFKSSYVCKFMCVTTYMWRLETNHHFEPPIPLFDTVVFLLSLHMPG